MIRIPLLWRSVCVLFAPPKATRSSAVRRLTDESAWLAYLTSALSLVLAAAAATIQRSGSGSGKHGKF